MLGWLWRASDRLRQARESRALHPDRALGRLGEDLAHRHLQRQGLVVCARNYRSPAGHEIDIVAWEGDTLVFVEVKTRTSDEHAAPDRAIDRDKLKRISRAAWHYARMANADWNKTRIDVVSVVLRNPPEILRERDVYRPTFP